MSGGGSWALALLAGGVVGFLGVGGVVAVGHRHRIDEAQRGWALEHVVVAATDVAEGAPLTLDAVAQRSVPEQFRVPSMLRPEDVTPFVGRPLRVAVQAGDPLLRPFFDAPTPQSRCLADARSAAGTLGLEADPGVAALLQRLEAAEGGAPEKSPP